MFITLASFACVPAIPAHAIFKINIKQDIISVQDYLHTINIEESIHTTYINNYCILSEGINGNINTFVCKEKCEYCHTIEKWNIPGSCHYNTIHVLRNLCAWYDQTFPTKLLIAGSLDSKSMTQFLQAYKLNKENQL